jgi:hypothetical protein
MTELCDVYDILVTQNHVRKFATPSMFPGVSPIII